jgi:aspartyl-tRNA(Asn)/glutamyl-tRNA(Gln) amidotransferase subunit A
MDANVLTDLSGAQMARLIASKELSPVELTEAYIDRIDKLNPKVNAYVTVCQEEALADARRAEEAVLRGDPLQPLHGLPLAAKDQFDTKGVTTTSGSRSLSHNVPPEDATVVARTKAAGAVLIGKTSMTQFASGLGDRWQFGEPPRNPWDLERDTIGSSNGSAIAITASMCAISLGEDTGGSIRCPSSATGAVGFRPTWGRLSRYRMHGLSWSMDSAGPITRSVEDAALMLNAIAGYDPKDTLTSKRPVPDYTQGLGQDIKGKRIGLIQEFMDPEFCEPQVVEAVTAAAKHLESLGATVEEVSLPMLRDARLIASPVTGSDAGHVHVENLRAHPEHYGRNLRLRLIVDLLIPGHILQTATRARAIMRREWLKLLSPYHVLIAPTLMFTLGKIRYAKPVTEREQARGRFGVGTGDVTIVAAFLGTPAMTVRCGFDSNGVPIGLMFMASPYEEERILNVGHVYEQSTPWHKRRPNL